MVSAYVLAVTDQHDRCERVVSLDLNAARGKIFGSLTLSSRITEYPQQRSTRRAARSAAKLARSIRGFKKRAQADWSLTVGTSEDAVEQKKTVAESLPN